MIAVPEEPWLKEGETLLCFGDSLTSAKNPGYVERLAAFLEPKGIRVVNAGLGGDKTPYALTRLRQEVIDVAPDAVSLFFGANDAVIGRGIWRDEPVVEPVTYRDNLVWMIHVCRLESQKIRKFSIAAPTGRMEGQSWIDFGDIRHEYCLAARKAAELADARFVPLDTRIDAVRETMAADEKGLKLTKDGVHMTAQGYALIADIMLETWRMK